MKTEEASQAILDLTKKKSKLKKYIKELDAKFPSAFKDVLSSEHERATLDMLRTSIFQVLENAINGIDSEILYFKCQMMKLQTNPQVSSETLTILDEESSNAKQRLSLIVKK